ncbi:hypothetical protein [Serratia fonticola]|uniref:hypothetical protein n=1 Tax=Serratia fonticola TaxID=47917 RepID=UPI003AAF7507
MANNIPSFEGQSLINSWKPFRVNIFDGKTKSERNRREDFNASCFDVGLLYVTPDLAVEIIEITKYAESLKIITDNYRHFNYINITRKIPSLLYNDRNEIKDMYRSEKYKFIKDNVLNEMIFRDEILSSNYFVTEKFVDNLKCDIKGIIFKEVGEV